MNKNSVAKIAGLDFHFLTSDGRIHTVSYSDFKNIENTEIAVKGKPRVNYPFPSLYHYEFDLHMECDGYTIIEHSDATLTKIRANNTPCPKIKDINIIVSDKVVEVTFVDGTKEKSVCSEPDTFSLESAISICISKRIMGGSSAYNNAVKRGIKIYEDKLKKEAADKAEQERIAKKREKRLGYKERRATKKAEEEVKKREQEKEEQIEIQKEAYLRAMDVLRSEGRGV